MSWLVELIVGLFRAILGEAYDHPMEPTKEEVRDVGHKAPDSPDDIFCPRDW